MTHSPDCLIELAFKFDAVHADLHTVGTLVGVAANMAENAKIATLVQSPVKKIGGSQSAKAAPVEIPGQGL